MVAGDGVEGVVVTDSPPVTSRSFVGARRSCQQRWWVHKNKTPVAESLGEPTGQDAANRCSADPPKTKTSFTYIQPFFCLVFSLQTPISHRRTSGATLTAASLLHTCSSINIYSFLDT